MMKRRIRRGFCAVLAMAMLLEGNVSVTLAAVANDKTQETAAESLLANLEAKEKEVAEKSAELEVVEKWDVKANESLEEDVLVVQGDFTSRVTRDAKEIEAGIVQFAGNLC